MVAVSIVTYHTSREELDRCTECLTSGRVGEIFIIDNSRDPDTEAWAAANGRVTYIPADNRGYGAGHNIALRRVTGGGEYSYHLVMNSDLRFAPDTIDRLEEFMDSHPDVGTVQPLIVSPDGEPQHTCRMLPTPWDVLLRRFLPGSWFVKSRDRYLLKHLDPGRAWNIPYHQGSFMFLRTDALREAGLFDERFFMYPEDIDLTRRIHRLRPTVYWPGATVVHDHRAASYKSLRMLWIHAVNMARYFNKWGWLRDRERKRFNSGIAPYPAQR